MKISVLLLAFLTFGSIASAQLVSSSCSAPDSVVQHYQEDADRLTVEWIYENELSYQDNIEIPEALSDTILDALIAVYNATDLAARDSVVEMFNVHTWVAPAVNSFVVNADPDQDWMQDLSNGIIPTSNSEVNELISTYELELVNYYPYQNVFGYHTAAFQSADNYNMPVLSSQFLDINGVVDAHENQYGGDGGDIEATINEDHVELIYEHAWGDCLAGCIHSRFWEFKVYYDCSVEFITSYGTSITSVREEHKEKPTIFPNPVNDVLTLEGIQGEIHYSVTTQTGQMVLEGSTGNKRIRGFDDLPAGIYILTISNANQKSSLQVIKR